MSNKLSEKSKNKSSFFLTIDIQEVTDKKRFFQTIAKRISQITGIEKSLILQSIKEREELSSTAFYQGLAFPHIILEDQVEPKLIVCKLKNNIMDWQCIDKTPVNTCLILLISKNESRNRVQVKRMSNIFKRFADDDFVSQISKCNSSIEVKEKL